MMHSRNNQLQVGDLLPPAEQPSNFLAENHREPSKIRILAIGSRDA